MLTQEITSHTARLGSVWRLEPHVCAACLGRIASRKSKDAEKVFRCTNCGASGEEQVKHVCACGMKIGKRDAGIRCVANEDRSPECMSEIIAREIG